MDSSESLSHSRWECKYHVVFIPKCRRKTLYEKLRPHLGEVFKKLAAQKECRIEEGHLMALTPGKIPPGLLVKNRPPIQDRAIARSCRISARQN